jgi:hypothetical protein
MTRKRKVGAVSIVMLMLTGGGIAAALWSANGNGSGQAKALTAQSLTVTAATGAADLYPGFTGGDVFFTITNPNPYPVTFTSMTPGTITSSNPTNCPVANVSVLSASGLSLTVGANTTSATQSIANVVTMANTAPDGCQGVTFTIAMTLAGSQA